MADNLDLYAHGYLWLAYCHLRRVAVVPRDALQHKIPSDENIGIQERHVQFGYADHGDLLRSFQRLDSIRNIFLPGLSRVEPAADDAALYTYRSLRGLRSARRLQAHLEGADLHPVDDWKPFCGDIVSAIRDSDTFGHFLLRLRVSSDDSGRGGR